MTGRCSHQADTRPRLLLAVGGDWLGQWLPVCIAQALPEFECRFMGQLWSSGNFVRAAGLPYRCWPWTHQHPAQAGPPMPNLTDFQIRGLHPDTLPGPVQRACALLWTMAQSELDSFRPDAVLSLTAESALGHVLDTLARRRGLTSIGLQTTFLRQSLLVHRQGAGWWLALREATVPAQAPGSAALAGAPAAAVRPGPWDHMRRRQLVWAARAERLLRAGAGAPGFDSVAGLLASLRPTGLARPGGFTDLGTADIADDAPAGMVLVALHRPVLQAGEPDWIDLLRFALAATPAHLPLVVRPHPDEPGRPLPDDLALAMRRRQVRLSRPGSGASLPALLRQTRVVLTISSAAGLQALQAGVPTVVIGPAFYARPGMAWAVDCHAPASVRARLEAGALPAPDPAVVQAFVHWIEASQSAALPDSPFKVVPASALAQRIAALCAGAGAGADRCST